MCYFNQAHLPPGHLDHITIIGQLRLSFSFGKPAGFMRDSPYHSLSPLPLFLSSSPLLSPTNTEEIPGKWEAEYSYDNLSTVILEQMIAANIRTIIFQYLPSPSFSLTQVFVESGKVIFQIHKSDKIEIIVEVIHVERLDKQEKEIMQEIWENRIDEENWNEEYWRGRLGECSKEEAKELRHILNSLRYKRYINYIGTKDGIKGLYIMEDGLEYCKNFFRFSTF